MRRNSLSHWSLCLIAFLAALAFVATPALAQAKGKKEGKKSEHGEVLQMLHHAHKLLAEADHDYDGHRATAAEEVHKAIQEIEGHKGQQHHGGKAGKKEGHHHEPQAISDKQLREAHKILEKAAKHLHGKHKAEENIKAAIGEIKIALKIK